MAYLFKKNRILLNGRTNEQTDERTNGRTNGRTVRFYYAPNFILGHKNIAKIKQFPVGVERFFMAAILYLRPPWAKTCEQHNHTSL